MAGSICVGCGRGFVVAGPDPAPYCSVCEPAAQAAHEVRNRRDGRGGGFLLFALILLVMGFFVLFLARADHGPEPEAPAAVAFPR